MKERLSLAKRIRSLQTCFCKERKFLAKLLEMGVAWSSYKEKRKEKKELKRRRELRSSMSASERAKVIKMKAQMEQQIQALEEQINLEKFARIASNRPQQLVKTLSSPAINKLAERREAPDLQSSVSESERLMVEACQFAQFMREHPLEKWTVGSLPNLTYL